MKNRRPRSGKLHAAQRKEMNKLYPVTGEKRTPFNGAIDNNTHHLLQLKRIPSSLEELRKELLLVDHRDIFVASQVAGSFEEALGTIAAMVDLVLDGEYEADLLFTKILQRLQQKRNGGSRQLDPDFVSVDLVERKDGVTIDFAGAFFDPALLPTPTHDGFSRFMREQGCEICETRDACRGAEKCLGKGAIEEVMKKGLN